MRINTNVSALNAQRLLSQTNEQTSRSMAKLSSGFRITRAADDAAGLAIANKFNADVRSMNAASRNIAEANSLVQIAEGATSSVADILGRMKELATQAASSTSDSQLGTLDGEFQDMKAEIERIVDATKYQGTELLDGSAGGTTNSLTVQIGAGTTSGVDTITLDLGDLSDITSALGDVNSLASASAAMGAIDTALDTVNSRLADFGSYQNRLDFASQNLATTIQNYSASESVIRDVDMASEMTKLSKNQILQQAGTAMLAQANQASQGVLQLLR